MSDHDNESGEFTIPDPIKQEVTSRLRFPVAAAATSAAAALLVVVSLALTGDAYQARILTPLAIDTPQATTRDRAAADRLASSAPRGIYVVVDSARNRLRVFSDGQLLREATCSTGTGIELRDPRNGRTWVFDTPLGERRVLNKRRNPVWTKPDWAFVEGGFLPSKDPRDRYDDVSLGDYALYLGDGYLIHGTLFQSLLGRPATHGCIRLGDEDLEYVYRTVPIGAPVYLF